MTGGSVNFDYGNKTLNFCNLVISGGVLTFSNTAVQFNGLTLLNSANLHCQSTANCTFYGNVSLMGSSVMRISTSNSAVACVENLMMSGSPTLQVDSVSILRITNSFIWQSGTITAGDGISGGQFILNSTSSTNLINATNTGLYYVHFINWGYLSFTSSTAFYLGYGAIFTNQDNALLYINSQDSSVTMIFYGGGATSYLENFGRITVDISDAFSFNCEQLWNILFGVRNKCSNDILPLCLHTIQRNDVS